MSGILVIDDDPQIRDVIKQILTREGYVVKLAADGIEGLRAFQAEPIDLVICDLIMPGKEGIEVLIELKRNNTNLRFVAMSGGGRMGPTDYLSLAKKLGAVATVQKPFSREEIIRVVREALVEV